MTSYKPRYFKLDEFKCKCCGKVIISDNLLLLLDRAREMAGIPFVITSGYRCEKHNAEIGGVPDSAHIKGLACDIKAVTSSKRYRIVKALMQVGFNRIGIASDFIHCDIDVTKPKNVIWLYNK